jgi:hypothetical protein
MAKVGAEIVERGQRRALERLTEILRTLLRQADVVHFAKIFDGDDRRAHRVDLRQ